MCGRTCLGSLTIGEQRRFNDARQPMSKDKFSHDAVALRRPRVLR